MNKIKIFSKFILYFLLIIISLILILFIVAYSILNSSATVNKLLQISSNTTNIYANIDNINFEIHPLNIYISKITVYDDQSKSTAAIYIEALELETNWSIFNPFDYSINNLTINNSNVDILRYLDGKFRWQYLNEVTTNNSSSTPKLEDPSADTQAGSFDSSFISVKNININNTFINVQIDNDIDNSILFILDNLNFTNKNLQADLLSPFTLSGDFSFKQGDLSNQNTLPIVYFDGDFDFIIDLLFNSDFSKVNADIISKLNLNSSNFLNNPINITTESNLDNYNEIININQVLIHSDDKNLDISGKYSNWTKNNNIDFNVSIYDDNHSFKNNLFNIAGDTNRVDVIGHWVSKNSNIKINSNVSKWLTDELKFNSDVEIILKNIRESARYWGINYQSSNLNLPNIISSKIKVNGNNKKIIIDELSANIEKTQLEIINSEINLAEHPSIDLIFKVKDLNSSDYIVNNTSNQESNSNDRLLNETKRDNNSNSPKNYKEIIGIIDNILQTQTVPTEYLDLLNQYKVNLKGEISNITINEYQIDNANLVFQIEPTKIQNFSLNTKLKTTKIKIDQSLSLEGKNKINLAIDIKDFNLNEIYNDKYFSGKADLNFNIASKGEIIKDHLKNANGTFLIKADKLIIAKKNNKLTTEINGKLNDLSLQINTKNIDFQSQNIKLILKNLNVNTNYYLENQYSVGLGPINIETFDLDLISSNVEPIDSTNRRSIIQILNDTDTNIFNFQKNIIEKKINILPFFSIEKINFIKIKPIELIKKSTIRLINHQTDSISKIELEPWEIDIDDNLEELSFNFYIKYYQNSNEDLIETNTNNESSLGNIINGVKINLKGLINLDYKANKIDLLIQQLLNFQENKTDSFSINGAFKASWETSAGRILIEDFSIRGPKSKFNLTSNIVQTKDNGLNGSFNLGIDIDGLTPLETNLDNQDNNIFPIIFEIAGNFDNYNFNLLTNKGKISTSNLAFNFVGILDEIYSLKLDIKLENFKNVLEGYLTSNNLKFENINKIDPVKINLATELKNNINLNLDVVVGDTTLSTIINRIINEQQEEANYEIKIDLSDIYIDDWIISSINDEPEEIVEAKTSQQDEQIDEEDEQQQFGFTERLRQNIDNQYKRINTNKLIDFENFPNLNIDGDLNISKISWHDQSFDDIKLKATYNKNEIGLTNISFNQNNNIQNKFEGSLTLTRLKSDPYWQMNLTAPKFNLNHVSKFLKTPEEIEGDIKLNLSLDSLGNDTKKIISTLRLTNKIESKLINNLPPEIDKYSCLATSALRASYFNDEVDSSSMYDTMINFKIREGIFTLNPEFNIEATSMKLNGGKGYFDINNGDVNLTLESSFFDSQKHKSCRAGIFTDKHSVRLSCKGNIRNEKLNDICRVSGNDVILTVSNIITSAVNPVEWIDRIWKYFFNKK